MGERIRENFEDFLNGLENVSKQEFFDDLKNIFSLFPDLFLTKDCSPDVPLVFVSGFVSVSNQKEKYKIPIRIQIGENYPNNSPLAFVDITSDQQIQDHPNIDSKGKCSLEIQKEWDLETSTILKMVEEMSQLFQSHPLSLFLEKTISREDEMNSEEKEKEGEEDSEKEEKENKKEESSDKTESSQKEDREEEKSEKEAREEEEEEEEESSYDFHVTTDQESRTDRSVDSPLITTSSSALTPERASFGLPGPASFSCSSLPSSSSSSSLSSSSSSLSSSPSSSLSSFSSSKLEDIPPKKAQKPGSVHDKVALLSKEMTFGRPPPSPLVGMSSSPSTSSPVIATLATPVSPSTPSKKRIASLGFGKIKKQNSTKDARASLKKSKKGKDNEAMTLSTGMSQPNLLKRDPSPRRQSVGSEREKEKEKKKKVVVDGSMPNYGLFQKHSLQEVKRKLIRVEGSKRYKDDSLMNKKGGSFNLIRTGHMNEDDDEEEEEEELDPKKKLKKQNRKKALRATAKFEIDQQVFKNLDALARTRIQVIREIYQTEQEYSLDLDIICEYFMEPISVKGILSPFEIETVFSCVEVIRGVSMAIVEKLTLLLSSDDGERKIGAFFVNVASMLKVYGAYVGGQDKALAMVEKCRKKNKSFESFLNKMMDQEVCRGLPLIAFLIKPTQRVCKYPLLVRELLKSTEETHEDFGTLKDALRVMEETTSYVNERKREIEKQSKMLEVSHSIQGVTSDKIVVRERYLILEGMCEKVNVHGKSQRRKLWLFNDALVYAAPHPVSSHTFTFKDLIPTKVCVASVYEDKKATLQLTRLDKKKKYLVIASSDEIMRQWVAAIMKQYREANGETPPEIDF